MGSLVLQRKRQQNEACASEYRCDVNVTVYHSRTVVCPVWSSLSCRIGSDWSYWLIDYITFLAASVQPIRVDKVHMAEQTPGRKCENLKR